MRRRHLNPWNLKLYTQRLNRNLLPGGRRKAKFILVLQPVTDLPEERRKRNRIVQPLVVEPSARVSRELPKQALAAAGQPTHPARKALIMPIQRVYRDSRA